MSLTLTVNGIGYTYPEQNDEYTWGTGATDWAAAVTQGMLQKAGGAFTLTAEVDFGATYGLKSTYFKSRTSTPATAGQFRLARTDVVSWRNVSDNANLDLAVNGSNQLTFDGNVLATGAAGDVTGPASSTDNAIARFDSTTGKLIQNSVVTVSDTGVVSGSDLTTGAASSTDNALARFDSTTGKVIQNSLGVLDDSGNLSGVVTASVATLNSSALTASKVVVSDGSKNLASATTSTTEVQLLTGLTSLKNMTNWGASAWTVTSNMVTNTTTTGIYRRVGDTIEGRVSWDFSGAPNAATVNFDLPSGLTVDTTKNLTTSTNAGFYGFGSIRSGQTYQVSVFYSDTNTFTLKYLDASAQWQNLTQAAPTGIANGDHIEIWFTVPITEWA